MKPRNRQHRSLNVSSSRWMAYAVAGLATASGGAISAEGAIHYTDPPNVLLRGFDRATFSLDDLGDKLIFVHRDHAAYRFGAYFKIVGRRSASVRQESHASTFSWVSNLKRGSLVSQGYLDASGFGTLAIYGGGYFGEPGIGFIGFAFNNGAGKQYGWARVQMGGWVVGGDGHKNNFKVLDYAYADPGEPIKAGQTSDEPVTGMGSLGLLAAGAAGLLTWRKSRRRVSSAAP
jgi:hypothetical protein